MGRREGRREGGGLLHPDPDDRRGKLTIYFLLFTCLHFFFYFFFFFFFFFFLFIFLFLFLFLFFFFSDRFSIFPLRLSLLFLFSSLYFLLPYLHPNSFLHLLYEEYTMWILLINPVEILYTSYIFFFIYYLIIILHCLVKFSHLVTSISSILHHPNKLTSSHNYKSCSSLPAVFITSSSLLRK